MHSLSKNFLFVILNFPPLADQGLPEFVSGLKQVQHDILQASRDSLVDYTELNEKAYAS